jgi:PBSX family phage terminase large subunit
MNATIVYQKIWTAAHELADDGSKKYRYIILEGSSRSSKTRSLLQAYYCYAGETEGARLSVWRDTAKDCRDTVGYDMGKVYPDLENYSRVNFHSTKSIYTFPTKSTIEVCGTDDVNKVHGYQGEVIWFNEPYKISKDTFDQLDMRTTDMVFIDWNPKQAHWIEELKKDPRTLVIHSTFKDNPFCPPEQRKKILSYQTVKYSHIGIVLGEHQAKEYDALNNPILFTEGQLKELLRCKENERKGSGNDFNWAVYGLGIKSEKPNRIFKWNEVTDDFYNSLITEIYTGIDWGSVDPWGILDAKYIDGCLYLHERNYLSEGKLKEKLTVTDRAQIDEKDEGFVKWYFNKFGIEKKRKIVCDTNRPEKTSSLRKAGWVYAVPASNKSILDGIDLLNDIKVFYTESSLNLKYEQENYSRQVDRYGIVLEDPEDENNHLIDPARYIALYLKRLGIIKNI